ncbi:glycerol-3-phosphate 1-O-acyltransferase PlsB [Vibrio salinus]|uniref:glycerol-3-phosphate 1-O-acyltransferase PlsB n=1 Tax=Vibrio salinus TaxID=2899784 RepID=UPI001E485C97|nr:glycerol-3-phosphate 1-O-acyltransferase PlsB [Vibrio salinus]MCE0493525.1 glycerol-3-phosphate 1-O-acyltransferase PlsB [Vibrio salinus]
MSYRQNFTSAILQFPLSLFTKSKIIPRDYSVNSQQPIIYTLPFSSNIDLATLRKSCKTLGLPDPNDPLIIDSKSYPRVVFIRPSPSLFSNKRLMHSNATSYLTDLLELHKTKPDLDIHIIPVAILWGRKPGKENQTNPMLHPMGLLKKWKTIIRYGRDCVIRFSPSFSLRHITDTHGSDTGIAHKLARVAQIHFARQQLAASGPALPKRKQLLRRLIQSNIVRKTIREEAKSRDVSYEKVQKEAFHILDEIAADFSYSLVKKGDKLLGWLWNRIYQGINVHNADTVRKLAQDGHEIVYVPCHKSHIDYLLLSYVLFHEGLVPPHIAAGINLNFFPAGPLFRKGGAFFLRRTFKGDKLYSTIFKEYLADLFAKGYAIEFFSEGGRSRTGRLLPAKTGMLSMTLQAMLKGLHRPVTLVPVYIGYEHVLEVSTYAKELRGKQKEKENAGMVFKTIRKLKNFGQGYVNFGEPIPLNQYLNHHVPEWSDAINKMASPHPSWLKPTVNDLAVEMMNHINDAVAVNGINLCAMTLLSSKQRALSKENLIEQISLYLTLLKNVPYSDYCTLPQQSASELVESAIELDKFLIENDSMGQIIAQDRKESVLSTYYRNNIIHLFIIPAILAQLLLTDKDITLHMIHHRIGKLFPFIKNELFLSLTKEKLPQKVTSYIAEFSKQHLILKNAETIRINPEKVDTLILFSQIAIDTLQRYAITMHILCQNASIKPDDLQEKGQKMARRLGRLYGINAPEFFDKHIFATMVNTIQEQGYINNIDQSREFKDQLFACLSPEIQLAIKEHRA